MAKAIKVTQFARISDTQFTAAGTCDGRPFVAKTIVYRQEPIFKVQEDSEAGTHKRGVRKAHLVAMLSGAAVTAQVAL